MDSGATRRGPAGHARDVEAAKDTAVGCRIFTDLHTTPAVMEDLWCKDLKKNNSQFSGKYERPLFTISGGTNYLHHDFSCEGENDFSLSSPNNELYDGGCSSLITPEIAASGLKRWCREDTSCS